ncbi:NUDIX domain-containing protein [Nostocoides sp. F2B08]|uniref:NUDIX hydrolase n=1 Tax=Nostocoides sp. F2B08 TaxID=2653936 RepID=UPI001263317F|nr:NUDIX domain-containing protein [Tetrasphaera sp. F2B08]KAB7745580.1 NUDIX domain-containing protein [Tetrasphaera sp. F2B08]
MEIDDELIDIYDASLRPLGRKNRRQAHLDGDWHRTFHCWVVRGGPNPAMLFQLRSTKMGDYPGQWDVSAAGHVLAGESILDSAREISEELGIQFDLDSLIFAGERIEVADDPGGIRNREYQSVFFLRYDSPIEQFRPDLNEVEGLLWLPIASGIELFSDAIRSTTCEAVIVDGKGTHRHDIEVARPDFVPRIPRYYLASLLSAVRVLAGESPIALG